MIEPSREHRANDARYQRVKSERQILSEKMQKINNIEEVFMRLFEMGKNNEILPSNGKMEAVKIIFFCS